jgi:hypothetical protein
MDSTALTTGSDHEGQKDRRSLEFSRRGAKAPSSEKQKIFSSRAWRLCERYSDSLVAALPRWVFVVKKLRFEKLL